MHDATDSPLVAARKAAMNAHAALHSLLTLANTMEKLDDDGMSIVETSAPILAAAPSSLKALNDARPSIKPNGPHFRVMEMAIEANLALSRAMLGEPKFLRSHWPALRAELVNLLNADELSRLDKDILSEFDDARERTQKPATFGGLPLELAKLAFEHNDLFQRLNKAMSRRDLFGIDPTEEIRTVARLAAFRDEQRRKRDEEELSGSGAAAQSGQFEVMNEEATPAVDDVGNAESTADKAGKSPPPTDPVEATAIPGEMNRPPSDKAEPGGKNKMVFEPGGFQFRGRRSSLKGKPWGVLKALYEAGENPVTLAQLQTLVWPDTTSGEEAVRSAVKAARKSVREAYRAVGVDSIADPIPNVNRGGAHLTAWKLILP